MGIPPPFLWPVLFWNQSGIGMGYSVINPVERQISLYNKKECKKNREEPKSSNFGNRYIFQELFLDISGGGIIFAGKFNNHEKIRFCIRIRRNDAYVRLR